jgi:protein tyrosine phosphatase (PTP) superfamily phosphohydrolase (DUF442 family)
MEIVRKINDDLAIAGTVALENWPHVAEEGFRSVLNLRSLDQPLLTTEQVQVESLGLNYINLPIDQERMSMELAVQVLRQIDQLSKPILICNSATLAAAMALMYIAMRQGETLQQAFQRAEKFGLFQVSTQPFVTSSIS